MQKKNYHVGDPIMFGDPIMHWFNLRPRGSTWVPQGPAILDNTHFHLQCVSAKSVKSTKSILYHKKFQCYKELFQVSA